MPGPSVRCMLRATSGGSSLLPPFSSSRCAIMNRAMSEPLAASPPAGVMLSSS